MYYGVSWSPQVINKIKKFVHCSLVQEFISCAIPSSVCQSEKKHKRRLPELENFTENGSLSISAKNCQILSILFRGENGSKITL